FSVKSKDNTWAPPEIGREEVTCKSEKREFIFGFFKSFKAGVGFEDFLNFTIKEGWEPIKTQSTDFSCLMKLWPIFFSAKAGGIIKLIISANQKKDRLNIQGLL